MIFRKTSYTQSNYAIPLPHFKEKACYQSRHQADNLAKLRFEFLSVLELIAQILCAVVVQKSNEALDNTHTCVLLLPQRRNKRKSVPLETESPIRTESGTLFLHFTMLWFLVFYRFDYAVASTPAKVM